jgi:hypothetical protein
MQQNVILEVHFIWLLDFILRVLHIYDSSILVHYTNGYQSVVRKCVYKPIRICVLLLFWNKLDMKIREESKCYLEWKRFTSINICSHFFFHHLLWISSLTHKNIQ